MSSNPQVGNSAKVEHTPGPWKTEQNANSIDIIAADGTVVAILINEDELEITAAMKGNAQALVTAPDMLAVLRSLTEFCEIVLDHGRLSGGQMKAKYGMDPMLGYTFVEGHCKKAQREINSVIRKAGGRV
ncbi:MAG TPA: hypothetical protein VGQ12_07390 [Candidatus Angelobacter sp.]|jgi:hypothetical protein|nr:hypothetical protein [Candidatus Angelobacter sp.]